MIPATTSGGGQCFAFPDVCKTPIGKSTPPIPYPNIAMCSNLNTGTCPSKIRMVKKFAATMQSKIPQSSGDEPGVAGGVVSGCNKGEAVYITGYPKVMLQGKVAAFLTSVTTQNKMNIVGAQIAPSQTKVLYSPVPVMGAGSNVNGSASSTTEQLRELSQREDTLDFVELNIVDDSGTALSHTRVDVTLPDGRLLRLRSDAEGLVRVSDVPPGSISYRLPGEDESRVS